MSATGVWINKRDSMMVLREDQSGQITGKYRSVVGRDTNVREPAGRASRLDAGKQMIGFSVCFQTDDASPPFGLHSICSWSGWVRNNTMNTRWLLTRSMKQEDDEWSSTIVGQDSFERLSDVYEEKHLTASTEALEQLHKDARKRI